MDWDYIEAEIMETILWRIRGSFSVEDVISVVCREYSIEFPKFKNNINTLKRKIFMNIESDDLSRRKKN